MLLSFGLRMTLSSMKFFLYHQDFQNNMLMVENCDYDEKQ